MKVHENEQEQQQRCRRIQAGKKKKGFQNTHTQN